MAEPINLEDLGKTVLAVFTKAYGEPKHLARLFLLWVRVPQAIDSNVLRSSKSLCTYSVDTKQPCDNLAPHIVSLLTELPQSFLVYLPIVLLF